MEKYQSLADLLGVQDPVHPERPVADPPSEDITPQQFCRNVLQSVQYRESLLRRILVDELPPNIEAMLWDRAYGKMKDHVHMAGGVTVTRVVREVVEAALDEDETPKNVPSVH